MSFFSTSSAEVTTVNSLSTTLSKDRNLKRLVQKFKKSSEVYRFRTKTGVYEDTIRRLASAKRFNLIEEILEDQKKYIDYSKEGFAVRLISLYGKSGMFANARKMFDEMPERNVRRTVLSFNALLAACVNSKKFDLVEEVFREMPEKLAVEPDVISYNTVIKAYCEMGLLGSARLLLDEMEKNGLMPDVISFNTALDGFYGKGGLVDGDELWSLMEEKGLVPDIRSYNSKMYGLVKEKRMGDAVGLIGEMRSKGIEPDVFTFNLVIEGFVKEENVEGAKEWYVEMRRSECAPNKSTLERLIRFLRNKGDLELAFELSKEVLERKLVVDEGLLQRVVDELVKASKVEEAKALLELGKNNNYRRYRLKLPSNE